MTTSKMRPQTAKNIRTTTPGTVMYRKTFLADREVSSSTAGTVVVKSLVMAGVVWEECITTVDLVATGDCVTMVGECVVMVYPELAVETLPLSAFAAGQRMQTQKDIKSHAPYEDDVTVHYTC